MSQIIDVQNKKLILDFGYLQNVIFKDDQQRLDKIIKKLNILNVNNYIDLINFFRGASIERGFICLINSNSRKAKKSNDNFLDAVLRVKLNDDNQNFIESGSYLGFYLDINLENPTLKVKNIFITQMQPEVQSFESEFGECPIQVVRFDRQIKPEQVIRECVVNPYNVRQINVLSNKFEIEREKWASYLSFFGWYLKHRQSSSEMFLNMGYKKMIRVDKNDIRNTATKEMASLMFSDNQYVYFDISNFKNIIEVINYKEVNVVFVDLVSDSQTENHNNLKRQLELFLTPLSSNKNYEKVFSDKNSFFDFAYGKRTDISDFNAVKNWIGDEEKENTISDYMENNKTYFSKYFKSDELAKWLKVNNNLLVKRTYLELENDFTEEQLKNLRLGYIAFIGAGEDALLDRMREVLKKVATGQSKNPYLINYLFNTNLISFSNKEEKIDSSIEFYNHLNDEQKLAVTKALHTKDIFILQGPPGTGKTQVISEMVAQFSKRGQKVLVSSQSNDAIQNVLERIPKDVNINAVRFINKSYSKQNNDFDVDNAVFNYYKLLDKAITTNIDFDESRLKKFYNLRQELESVILNSQGMHETRNKIRSFKKTINENENDIAKLKDKKLHFANIRKDNENEIFHTKNFISALNDLTFNTSIENTKLSIRIFEKDMYDDFIELVNDLNYTFENNKNIAEMFLELFDYIKSRDSNFSKYENAIVNLNILKKNADNNKSEIDLLNHEIEFLLNEINGNKFIKTFEKISKDYSAKLENDLYKFEFEIIETGDEAFLEKEIEKLNIKNNNLVKSINTLLRKSSSIDGQLNIEIEKLNKEFKFDLSVIDPDMEDVAKNKLNIIESDLKNKKRRKEFIGPLIKEIKEYYKNNYANHFDNNTMGYDAKKYYSSVFDNLVNVFALTLTSPDKFKINKNSKLFKYGVEEINMKFIDVDVVIVDEASKANLLELFMALMYGKVLILVGDYRQLPPIINIHDDNIEEVNNKYNKSFNYKTIINLLEDAPFKNLIASNNKSMISNLKLQYRSHKDIVEVMNYFYGQELKSDITVETTKQHLLNININEKNIINGRSSAYWIDSTYDNKGNLFLEQSEGYSNSLYNDLEVKVIIELLIKINRNIKEKKLLEKPSVAIINFYSLQVKKMKKAFDKISTQIDSIKVVIDTVDAFQGREADYVFVSLVRNPENISLEYGREFLKKYERINVAFSRARKLLMIVGSKRTVSELMVEIPDYENPNIVNTKAVYDDIYSMLWNKNAVLTSKDILGED